jgi:fatty acid synthase
MILQVCREAGIDARTIRYVEAHGTGTQAGDGQELAALDAAYGLGAQRSAADPLLVGSVKSNMGHCEGASGLAGARGVIPWNPD